MNNEREEHGAAAQSRTALASEYHGLRADKGDGRW